MYNKSADSHQATLFGDLESMLNQKHSLYILANLIDWDVFESGFKKHYCSDNGRPSTRDMRPCLAGTLPWAAMPPWSCMADMPMLYAQPEMRHIAGRRKALRRPSSCKPTSDFHPTPRRCWVAPSPRVSASGWAACHTTTQQPITPSFTTAVKQLPRSPTSPPVQMLKGEIQPLVKLAWAGNDSNLRFPPDGRGWTRPIGPTTAPGASTALCRTASR